MGINTTLFTTAGDEVDDMAEMHRRGWLKRGHAPGKHRAQDYIARLERDLAASRALNKTLSDNLSAEIAETAAANARVDKLMERVDDLDRRLQVAEKANEANANVMDFRFQQRLIDGHEDMATMPVPRVELLADGPDLRPVAADAAVAMLNRIAPKVAVEPVFVPAYMPSIPETTPSTEFVAAELEEADDEMELYNDTGMRWGARQTPVRTPVTWGGVKPASRTLHADMSVTGTFRVVPLHQRDTGPTALPTFVA